MSALVLHYVEGYAGLLRRIAGWLTPGGGLVYSTEHPIYTARLPGDGSVRDDAGRRTRWALDRYTEEGPREESWFVPGVRKVHRTFATLIDGVLDAGLTVERVVEPIPSEQWLADHPQMSDERHRPIKATATVPIVGVDLESDPIAKGWAATLAHPGGNFTGFVLDIPEMSGKQLQFLKELKPDLRRVAVLGDPRVNEVQSRATEAAARGAGLTIQALSVRDVGQAGRAAGAAAGEVPAGRPSQDREGRRRHDPADDAAAGGSHRSIVERRCPTRQRCSRPRARQFWAVPGEW